MKYKIENSESGKFNISFVQIHLIAPKVLFIHIDTDDYKWPEVIYGADDGNDLIILTPPGDNPLDWCKITFIPEVEWEKDILLAKHSGRYGWGGFGVARELLDDI